MPYSRIKDSKLLSSPEFAVFAVSAGKSVVTTVVSKIESLLMSFPFPVE